MTPLSFSLVMMRFTSRAARSGPCGATAPRPAKRVGCALMILASSSLARSAMSPPSCGAKACTPGAVMPSRCMSTPKRSISARRMSRSDSRSTSGPL